MKKGSLPISQIYFTSIFFFSEFLQIGLESKTVVAAKGKSES